MFLSLKCWKGRDKPNNRNQKNKQIEIISHVYKQIKALHVDKGELGELVRELAGKTLPSFKAFADGFKGAPCLWFGFATLRKLNPKFQIEAKVKRQNKAEAKK